MPGSMSDFLEVAVLNSSLRGVAFPVPTGVWVSLHTASPQDNNVTSTEVTTAAWPGYVRQSASNGGAVATGWTVPASGAGSTSNALMLTFPAQAGATPVTVTHFGLYDAASNGNLLYWASLTVAKTLNQTDVLTLPVGSLTVSID